MGIALVIILIVVVFGLLIAVYQGWIDRKTVELVSIIIGIVGGIAAIAVFIVPAAVSFQEPESDTSILPTQPSSPPTPTVNINIDSTVIIETEPNSPDNTLTLYDDFNDSAYDGKFNPELWGYAGTGRIEVRQDNDVVIFTTTSNPGTGNNALFPVTPETWAFEHFGGMEAKLKLDSNRRGQGSFIKIMAFSTEKINGHRWWAECQLGNYDTGHTSYFCNVNNDDWIDGDVVYEYETPFINGEYDTWYVSRIEIDPETVEIKFYLNDGLVGSYRPKNADKLSEVSFYPSIGSWVNEGESFTGYFDDVRIGQ